MSHPQNLDTRVTALEGRVTAAESRLAVLASQVTSLQSALSGFTTRFTGIEQELLGGRPRLAALEEAARGFETRVQELESKSHEPSNSDAARLTTLEGAVSTMASEVTRLSQVARPARSVVREQLASMQAQMEEILTRLPSK